MNVPIMSSLLLLLHETKFILLNTEQVQLDREYFTALHGLYYDKYKI